MRHDIRLHGRTTQGEDCVAMISVYTPTIDSDEIQKELDSWTPHLAWFLKKPGSPDVPAGAEIDVVRVERLEKRPPQQRQFQPFPMQGNGGPPLPPGLMQIFGGMFKLGPDEPDEPPSQK